MSSSQALVLGGGREATKCPHRDIRGVVATGSSSGLLSGPESFCLWPKALGMKRHVTSSAAHPQVSCHRTESPQEGFRTGPWGPRAGAVASEAGWRSAGGQWEAAGYWEECRPCWAPTGIMLYGWFTLLSCIFTCKWGSENLRATHCSLSHCPHSANSHLADQRASPAGLLANLLRFRRCGHSVLTQHPRTEGGHVRVPLCGVPVPRRAPWRLGALRNPGRS